MNIVHIEKQCSEQILSFFLADTDGFRHMGPADRMEYSEFSPKG